MSPRSSSVVACIFALVCWPLTPAAQGADLYVDGDRAVVSPSGSVTSGGSGTPFDPFWSLSQAGAVLTSGDTVHVAGICRESILIVGQEDVTVRQWAGRAQAQVRGDVPIPASMWLPGAGQTFHANIGGGGDMRSVVFNWDTTTALGGVAQAGHLVPAPSQGVCQATPDSWYFEPAINRLHVNLAGADPRLGGQVAWCRSGSGVAFIGCTRPRAEGLHAKLWTDWSPGTYSIMFGSCTYPTARWCATWDGAYHSIGAYGLYCVGARIEQCQFRGQRAGSLTVLHGENGPVSGLIADCTFHMYTLLRRDGTPLNPNAAVCAFYSHTGVSAAITDAECRRCVAWGYPGHPMSDGAFSYGNITAPVAAQDEDDWRRYPVRFVDCRVFHSDRLALQSAWGPNIKNGAYVRCLLDVSAPSVWIPITLQTSGATHRILFDHCIVYSNGTGKPLGELMQIGPGGRVIARNSTFYNFATDAHSGSQSGIARLEGLAYFKARQCVFGMASPGPFVVQISGPNRPASDYDIKHCWYRGFSDTAFIQFHSQFGSKAAYAAQIDGLGAGTAAIHDVNPYFLSENAAAPNFAPAPGGPLRILRFWFSPPAPATGINNRAYDGHWGPYQYGWSPGVPGRP